MNDHYIITADRGHLRIFGQRLAPGQLTPALDEVQAMDFPHGKASYTVDSTDVAGRFQGSRSQGRGPGAPTARTGMSIDERLPMQSEEDRREITDLVAQIERFLQHRPGATWDFAAGPTVHNALLKQLSPATKSRLRRSVSKDLVNQPTTELVDQFGLPA